MTDAPGLFGNLFVDDEMAAILSDDAALQGMLDFEAALARAEAAAGLFPAAFAETIADACRAELYDIAEIGRATTLAGNPAIPLVKALTARVAERDQDAARWVHYGATSQDVIDTGRALQHAQAVRLVLARSARLACALAALARSHRDTPMIGRTFLQHAVPISFGLKAANWLAPIVDFRAELVTRARGTWQLGGAAGSLASLGDRADAVTAAFARAMPSLDAPRAPWHAQRSGPAALACTIGLLSGHLGKIAQDVALMAQTEIGELAEREAPGKGGSSAMPHKRNPVLCTLILAAAKRAPGLVGTMLAGMPQEHERAMGGWHAEWRTLDELFALAGAALLHAVNLIEGLQVFPERMRANLDLTHGLVMAERVSLALVQTLGRSEAHHLLEEASRTCVASGRHLRDVLAEDPRLAGSLSPAELDRLFDPVTYRGATDAIIDRILAACGDEPAPTRP